MTEPAFNKKSFRCLHCDALAQMHWRPLHQKVEGHYPMSEFWFATCQACQRKSLWMCDSVVAGLIPQHKLLGRLLWPGKLTAATAHEDFPDSCVGDYNEAREVASASPRAAAALLRLCVQKICVELGLPGKNINEDIAVLVKRGLPEPIKQSLDFVRITGNNAVHPGEMSAEDHAEHVNAIFELVNLIVENLISQPKRIAALHARLPQGALAAIERRDGGGKNN